MTSNHLQARSKRELAAIARRCGARLHVVPGSSATPGMMGPAHILSLVGDVRSRDVYVCGPPGMTDAVGATLARLGVPPDQRHVERFAFAA